MAMQAGVQTSKILILLGAGVSGSIILRHGRLSDLIAQLHDLLKGAEGVESTPYKYDGAQLAAQIRQLANEIKELSMANPVTIFNGDSNSSYASYLVPAAAVGAMGYCYMWWKGWSFSDVMFVTKKNMADAVASVSKQLDDLSDTLAATKKHLSKKIATMDWKVDELNETSNMILNDVTEMRSSISKIGFDFKELNELISGIEGKIETLESKQDVTLSGLWHLCNIAGVKDSTSTKVFQDVGARLPIDGRKSSTNDSLSGLRFLTEDKEATNVIHKPAMAKEIAEMAKPEEDKPKPAVVTRSRVHRTYPSGISWVSDAAGLS